MSALASYNPIVIPEKGRLTYCNNVISAQVAPTILHLVVGIKAAPFLHWLTLGSHSRCRGPSTGAESEAFLRVIGAPVSIAFISARFAARSRSGVSSSSRNARSARSCVSSMPGPYCGTVTEELAAGREPNG
jgi:hypothetical protein